MRRARAPARGRCAAYHPRAVSERSGSPQEPADAAGVAAVPVGGELGPASEAVTSEPGAGRQGLARNTAIFSIATGLSRIAGPGARGRRGALLRHQRLGVGVHDRLPDPEPRPRPVRRRRAERRLRPGLHGVPRARPPPRRAPARLDAVLADPARARRDLGVLHRHRGRDRCRCSSRATSSRRQLVDLTVGLSQRPVPGRRAARPQRPARRDPQRLQPLHDPGDRAAGLEPRDHRRADRAAQPLFEGDDQIYAYAIGVLLGTIVQLLMVDPGARPDRLPAAVPLQRARPRLSGACSS